MSFQKGQSGNPGGRPKADYPLQQLARTHSEEALKTLVSIMRAKKTADNAKIAAACAILDRGYGKPGQAHEITGKDGNPIEFKQLDDKEVARRLISVLLSVQQEAEAANEPWPAAIFSPLAK